jgi:Xaa-Pro aminopeptidase
MVQDGVSLTKVLIWLKKELDKREVSEVEVAEKLKLVRSEHKDYVGESFAAIVGYASNGAIIHYHPMPGTCANIKKEGVLLLDCGAQYKSGTTDITRTIALSKPKKSQKLHYTLVLKGHINLARARFSHGTRGIQLDILARLPLWENGLNFGHGTGHGVGYFLNVHEPPQGFIAGLGERGTTIFEAGMLTSNEPGFYEEGSHGIRIENLVLSVDVQTTPYGKFLGFDTVSLFPIDTRFIETKLMSVDEKKWLNKYHDIVFKKLSPYLKSNEVKWLKKQCRHIH